MVGIVLDCSCLLIIFHWILQGSMKLWSSSLVDESHWKGTLFAVSLYLCFVLWNLGSDTCSVSNNCPCTTCYQMWCTFFFLGIFILLYISFQCHKNFTAMSHNIGETFQWCYCISSRASETAMKVIMNYGIKFPKMISLLNEIFLCNLII